MRSAALQEPEYAIDIFGKPAGVLVANGGRFVYRAADPTFSDLDHCCFACVGEAETAVHTARLRRQHRGRPGTRSGGCRF